MRFLTFLALLAMLLLAACHPLKQNLPYDPACIGQMCHAGHTKHSVPKRELLNIQMIIAKR